MSLQDIINAPFNYQDDLRILPDRSGFIYGIHSSQTSTWEWRGYGQDLQENEINAVLITNGYRPIDKRTEAKPFQNRWDYRKKEPDWPTFREWLDVYYTHKLDEAKETQKWWADKSEREKRDAMRWPNAYISIYPLFLEKVHTPTMELMDLHTWIWDQYETFDPYTSDAKRLTYKYLGEMTRDYIEWMEKIEHRRQYPD